MAETTSTYLTCARCNVALEFAGTKNFHEGSKLAQAFLGIWAENTVLLDVYYCPTCGHVEMFAQEIGRELRGTPVEFDSTRQ